MGGLDVYCLPGKQIYLVGSFSDNVTVYSQQVRALNLVHALIENGAVKCLLPPDHMPRHSARQKIAIIGAGVAGLSVAAALLAKRADCAITVFEQRDTLLPLQNGSDSRWLHPRIYDWPGESTGYGVAMLPVLNWVAGRASDVAVQMLGEWKTIVTERRTQDPKLGDEDLKLFCNAKHLRLFETGRSKPDLKIEFVAEERESCDGTELGTGNRRAQGGTQLFDLAIIAAGFGTERDDGESYWRNDTYGQPSLEKPRRTYVVSGQGDGAIIDLQRLCITQFRQDRILPEMFLGNSELVSQLKKLNGKYGASDAIGLAADLDKLRLDPACKDQLKSVQDTLRRRLRRDTEVIFHVQVKQLSELFEPGLSRISFQNRLMLWLLYECGAFVPSSLHIDKIVAHYDVLPKHIIRRHGTDRMGLQAEILSEPLYKELDTDSTKRARTFLQNATPTWSGGYFALPGTSAEAEESKDDELRATWRKEYMPGPTVLLASTLCASIAGRIVGRLGDQHMRVTLHRAVLIGNDEVLQQCCDYAGKQRKKPKTAARTYPADIGMIGLAYGCRKIVRSKRRVCPEALQEAMKHLRLQVASRRMEPGVRFVLAIPILEPEVIGRFTAPRPVAGVVYIDSDEEDFFIEDDLLREIVLIMNTTLEGLQTLGTGAAERLWNVRISPLGEDLEEPKSMPRDVEAVLEFVPAVESPRVSDSFQFNFDYSDVAPPPN